MSNLRPALYLILAIMSLAPGCGDSVLSGPSAVTGGIWKLRSIETTTAGLISVGQPLSYTVEFGAADRLAVKADCNVCGGSYSISGSSLQIGPLACTQAFCGPSSKDGAFLDVLTGVRSFGVRGIELSIDSSKGTLRLSR